MAGNDHIPTAPKDVIGDDGDLREMRDALRAGKHVVLAPDGKVYVASDADKTAPMTTAQEDFIEAKLGQVVSMARMGYAVGVQPDGSIAAERMDHKARVRVDMDKGFSDEEKQLIQSGISDGALVRLHPDGLVEYFLPADAKPPPGAHARSMEKVIADEIASGRLAQAWQDGEAMAIQPDGSIVYQTAKTPPPGFEFPEDVGWGHPPLTTADQLEAEAKGLELGAGAARRNEHQDFQDETATAGAQRDAAALAKAGAEATATAADRQVQERQARLDAIRTEQARAAADATQKRDAGDAKGAEEAAERVGQLLADDHIAERELAAAQSAAKDAHAAAAKATDELAAGEAGVKSASARRAHLEDVFDTQEDQARVYRQAATEMREAERLDAAYADLKARDVPDADRVKDAAALHRARAEELRTQAEAFDKAVPETAAAMGPPSSDDAPISGVELPPRTPEGDQEPVGLNDPAPPDEGTAVVAQAEVDESGGPPSDPAVADPAVADPAVADPAVADPAEGDPMAGGGADLEPTFADASDVTGEGLEPGMDDGGGGGDAFEA